MRDQHGQNPTGPSFLSVAKIFDRMATLSSPNRIVWEYFESLRRLVAESSEAKTTGHRRQSAALAVVMSVTVVEIFLNLWFRVRIEERLGAVDRASFLRDLSHPRPASLDRKLKEWPKRYLGSELDMKEGAGAEFMKIKALRNSIIHFASSHSTFEHDNVIIHGLADTTDYDALSFEQAKSALFAAEDIVVQVFRLAGVEDRDIPQALHSWAGRVPV